MAGELENLVERANLDPKVHVIALSGSGPGFRGGYDCAFAGSAEPVPPGGHRR
jgi:enoyl-CoA hydratase